MKVKANGQLRHQFFGTYSAVIALGFDDEYQASKVLPLLGSGWKVGSKPYILSWHGDADELDTCKEVLGSFGADKSKIDSCAKSIDFGEKFTIEVEIAPQEQLSLL